MKDGNWKTLSTIQLGDHVWNAGQVYGIVNESVTAQTTYCSISMSAAQLVYDPIKHKWVRNLEGSSKLETPRIFTQLLTAHMSAMRIRNPKTGCEMYVRDYREIPNPEMEAAYVEQFNDSEKLNARPGIQTVC